VFGRGTAWLDAGTPEALLQASQFVHAIEARQALMIGCPEEVAFRMGYISAATLSERIRELGESEYSGYLAKLLHE
jgi:glucose-1-phosphate thymidylyltransferase